MANLTSSEWIAIIGIILAFLIGVIQIMRNSATKSGKLNVNQASGAFSKGDQKIDLKVEQNDK